MIEMHNIYPFKVIKNDDNRSVVKMCLECDRIFLSHDALTSHVTKCEKMEDPREQTEQMVTYFRSVQIMGN